MSKRSQFEVDILAKNILRDILDARAAKLNSRATRTEVQKFIKKHKVDASLKKMENIQSQIVRLSRERNNIAVRLQKLRNGNHAFTDKEQICKDIAVKISKYKPIKIDDVKEQIIISLDEGADALKSNITKMFL